MGCCYAKYKICANYVHFYMNDHLDGNVWHGLKFHPCMNAKNWDFGEMYFNGQIVPKSTKAIMIREFPKWCFIEFCENCYKQYYQKNDFPDSKPYDKYIDYFDTIHKQYKPNIEAYPDEMEYRCLIEPTWIFNKSGIMY